MFAPFPRTKRPRSPSPPLLDDLVDLASPLDLLIKRRRREASFNPNAPQGGGPYAYPFPAATQESDEPESSTAWLSRAGVNGRRSRQWQHLNAPSSSQSGPSTNHATSSLTPNSQPVPHSNFGNKQSASPDSVEQSRAYSQPERVFGRQTNMSSSPIRHHAPGSSPFRVSSGTSGGTGIETPVSQEPPMLEEEGWGDDELGQEWGEYARENSVLCSIHKNRTSNFATPPNPHSYPTMTPIRPVHNPYQSYDPRSRPVQYRDHPPSSGSTQFPQSSPYPRGAASDITHFDSEDQDATDIGEDGEDSSMEVLDDWPMSTQEAETRRRYEDANRLLAELAVARRRRWGDT